MSDSTTPAAPAAAAPAAERGGFAVLTQYIKDLSFENPNAPAIFAAIAKTQPKLTVSIDVTAQKMQGRLAETVLKLRVDAKLDDKVCFILEVAYGALCSIDTAAPRDVAERYLLVDAPREVFPYLRHLASIQTRDAGYQPLLLQGIDFAALFERRKAEGGLIRSEAPAKPH